MVLHFFARPIEPVRRGFELRASRDGAFSGDFPMGLAVVLTGDLVVDLDDDLAMARAGSVDAAFP